MRTAKDITGERFGRLVALERMPAKNKQDRRARWRCRCDCGNENIALLYTLLDGRTRSCGCGLREALARGIGTKHGMRRSSEYQSWREMHSRCHRDRDWERRYYQDRGITVCPQWSSFEQFFADVGPAPSPNHSLDRIDNAGPYSPDNCRWATRQEQMRNTRATRMLTAFGRTQSLTAWAQQFNLGPTTLAGRLNWGWPIEEALTTPTLPRGKHRPGHSYRWRPT